MGKLLKSLLATIDGLITILSPIAAIFYVLGAVLLFAELTDHPGRVSSLAEEGELSMAVVDYVLTNGDVYIKFEDSQNRTRSAMIEKDIYTTRTIASLTAGSSHLVRYDPGYRYEPALENHWSEFASYRSRIDGLLLLLGVSFVILIIRPDIHFISYVTDWQALYNRTFPTPVSEEKA